MPATWDDLIATWDDLEATWDDIGQAYFQSSPPRSDGIQVFVVDKYGTRYGELPTAVIGDTTWKLNAPGQTVMTFISTDPHLNLIRLIEREVQVVFNNSIDTLTGEPVCFWGVLGNQSGKAGQVNYTCDEVSIWLKRRVIENASIEFDTVDQFDIGWGLITAAQSGPYHDLNFTASYSASGHIRSRIYQRDQHPNILDALTEFPTLLDGFDWRFDYDIAAGHRLWVPSYPHQGQVLDTVFSYPRNIVDFELSRNPITSLANKTFATGGTANGAKFEQQYEDAASEAQYGTLVTITSDGSEDDVDWLLDKATDTTNRLRAMPTVLTIVAKELPGDAAKGIGVVPILGHVHVGDIVTVNIVDGANNVPFVPLRVNQITRRADGNFGIEFINPTDVLF